MKKLVKAGSIDKFLSSVLQVEPNDVDRTKVSRKLIRLRIKHDFPFWAAILIYIHNKKGREGRPLPSILSATRLSK